MKNMTPAAVAAAVNGRLCGAPDHGKEITAVTTDSRKIQAGCLFAAIKGERVDGHDFLLPAASGGAGALLAERIPEEEIPAPVILVPDVPAALRELAAWYLDQLQIPTVGIIGSAGKTSTKEMVASVLAQRYRVGKTQGNFNNELGVPLTVFSLTEKEEIAVIEMGINHFGEMTRLARIVRPDTAVITNIGTAHLEFLGSRDGILQAKTEVFAQMRPGARAVLNDDDDKLETVGPVAGAEPIRFGIDSERADVCARQIVSRGLEGTECVICMGEKEIPLTIPVPGRFSVYNALAAAAVGVRYGLTPDEIRAGIAAAETLAGRFHLIRTDRFLVVDDCYNANPDSMIASLRQLADASGRRVAILGDMGELGEQEEALHRKVGACAAELGTELVCCVGERSAAMAKEAEKKSMECGGNTRILHFNDKAALLEALPELVKDGDTILVKASHFMAFDGVVEALKNLSARP